MSTPGEKRPPKVAVVGPCASGKSTLVSRLLENGYDAHAIAQEHSAVRDLWKSRKPDLLVALDVSLEVVRQRRSPTWLEAVYERQHKRLKNAYEAADIMIDTAKYDADEVFAITTELIREFESGQDA